MSPKLQAQVYRDVLQSNVSKWRDQTASNPAGVARNCNNVMMELRKASAHPLLLPNVAYTEDERVSVGRLMRRFVAPYWDWELDKVRSLCQFPPLPPI